MAQRDNKKTVSIPQGPDSVNNLLTSLLSGNGMASKIEEYRSLRVWHPAVGDKIAEHTRPTKIREGVLEVIVDSPIWMQQLQLLKPQLLAKLNALLKGTQINDLFFRQGRLKPIKREPVVTPPPEINESDRAKAKMLARNATDQELRESIEAAISKQKAWQRRKKQSSE